MVLTKRLLGILSAIILILVAVSLGFVRAQETGGGNGLQLTKTKTEVVVEPGSIKTITIGVKNITPVDVVVTPTINDFKSDNESGSPQLIVDPNDKSEFSIAGMVQGLNSVELAPGEARELEYTISVSSDTAPGSYFGAIRFSVAPKSTSGNQSDQVALNASVASLVFVDVPGDIKESVKLESITIFKGDRSGDFFLKPPTEVGVRIANEGNSFSRPFGRVSVMRGDTEIYGYELNDNTPRNIVLPKSSRTFKDEIKNVGSIGRYQVIANISASQGGSVITIKKYFWVIPMWLIIAAIVLVIGLIGLVIFMKKRIQSGRSRKNRRR